MQKTAVRRRDSAREVRADSSGRERPMGRGDLCRPPHDSLPLGEASRRGHICHQSLAAQLTAVFTPSGEVEVGTRGPPCWDARLVVGERRQVAFAKKLLKQRATLCQPFGRHDHGLRFGDEIAQVPLFMKTIEGTSMAFPSVSARLVVLVSGQREECAKGIIDFVGVVLHVVSLDLERGENRSQFFSE